MTNEEKLKKLGLFSLENIRLKKRLIKVFECI